jgi:CRISPR-associated protein Csh1
MSNKELEIFQFHIRVKVLKPLLELALNAGVGLYNSMGCGCVGVVLIKTNSMIQELINFTETLNEDIVESANTISNGVHIFVDKNDNNQLYIKNFFMYNGEKIKVVESYYEEAVNYEEYSSYISMNQQQKFDKNQKIHSASPFSFAFNFSLGDKKKEIESSLKELLKKNGKEEDLNIAIKDYKINEVKKSIPDYFSNAIKLCLESQTIAEYKQLINAFEIFCTEAIFIFLKTTELPENDNKKSSNKKAFIINELKEKDYVRVYLCCVPAAIWKSSYERYFENEYPPLKYNTNDFNTTYNQKKPFLIHQTASFDKNIKITGKEAAILKVFDKLISAKPKLLPNPLPIFLYKEELQNKIIGIFKEDGKIKFQEIIKKLWKDYKNDFQNYYLIYWLYGKDFQIFDFDFVSQFEYEVSAQIQNHFHILDKGSKELKKYPLITNIFDVEDYVFKPLLQNIYYNIDYFKDLDSEDYKDRKITPNKIYNNRFTSYSKYRKAVYDFVYKSQRQAIQLDAFNEMVFNSILDDIKQTNEYGVKEKLNIWYSYYEMFNPNKNNITMASKLKEYQEFVSQLISDENKTEGASDEKFAFTAGQVIDYILNKSKSADTSFQLLEPYLQQAKCAEFKRAIANDFARYKHENFSKNFERAAAFVLSYETDANLKHLLPEILSGVFSNNQLYPNKK